MSYACSVPGSVIDPCSIVVRHYQARHSVLNKCPTRSRRRNFFLIYDQYLIEVGLIHAPPVPTATRQIATIETNNDWTEGITMMNTKRFAQAALIAGVAVSGPAMAELSGNLTVNNNYIWRGLTQTTNEASVSGGMDYAHDSGFYAGTWISNVQYGADDTYSFEHDLYLGMSGGTDAFAWDVGYLYYNYDDVNEFDFGEVYFSVGFGGLSATAYVLTNTEAEEGPGQDFGAGEATYLSLDYGFETANGLGISFHVGSHDGDFVEAFNGIEGYMDYNVTIAKNGFGLMVSGTDIDSTDVTGSENPGFGSGTGNDELKFVVSYSVDFDLNP